MEEVVATVDPAAADEWGRLVSQPTPQRDGAPHQEIAAGGLPSPGQVPFASCTPKAKRVVEWLRNVNRLPNVNFLPIDFPMSTCFPGGGQATSGQGRWERHGGGEPLSLSLSHTLSFTHTLSLSLSHTHTLTHSLA